MGLISSGSKAELVLRSGIVDPKDRCLGYAAEETSRRPGADDEVVEYAEELPRAIGGDRNSDRRTDTTRNRPARSRGQDAAAKE